MERPLLLLKPIPGQEKANADFFVEKGVAHVAETLEELKALSGMFLKYPQVLEEMRRRIVLLKRELAEVPLIEALREAADLGEVRRTTTKVRRRTPVRREIVTFVLAVFAAGVLVNLALSYPTAPSSSEGDGGAAPFFGKERVNVAGLGGDYQELTVSGRDDKKKSPFSPWTGPLTPGPPSPLRGSPWRISSPCSQRRRRTTP